MSNLIKLVDTLRASDVDDTTESFSETIQIQLATAIAMVLTVPVVMETNGTTYFNLVHGKTVRTLVSKINELYLLDVSMVSKLIEKNYVTRYNLIHRPTEAIDAVVSIANCVAQCVNENATNININSSDLTRLGVTAGALINEIKENN